MGMLDSILSVSPTGTSEGELVEGNDLMPCRNFFCNIAGSNCSWRDRSVQVAADFSRQVSHRTN